MWRSKPPRTATLTGVRGVLKASHRSRETGQVHSHEWQITVWINPDRRQVNAVHVRMDLLNWINQHEGRCLPDAIAWAEDMARDIRTHMEAECDGYSGWRGCVHSVEIVRHTEGLLAKWCLAA